MKHLKPLALAFVCVLALAAGPLPLRAAPAVTSTPAPVGDNPTALELKGLIIPYEQANLSSRSTGVIRVMKEEGAEVRKDEVVVALEDEAEKAQLDSQKALLEKRKQEQESNRILRSKNGSSLDEERTAQTNAKTAEAQVRQAEAYLDKKVVKSPFDGVVVRRIRQPGEAVDQYLPVLSVVNLSKVYLETYLPAARLKDVQPGQEVKVTVADLPGRTFTGKVEFVSPVVDPSSGESRMKVLLANGDRALRSGLSAVGVLDVKSGERR